MAIDEGLAEEMRAVLAARGDIDEKKMFGGLAWMERGNMLCGTRDDDYLFRVGKDGQAAALKLPGAKLMEMGGRTMAGFVWVDGGNATEYGLDRWVDLAAAFVDTLPPK
ncbi:MAG: TfoX/Sxy family protein [Rhodobiaceae bacterium]|nr:TfoX/Sxy family protein [Rhodobiaceae bacterium]